MKTRLAPHERTQAMESVIALAYDIAHKATSRRTKHLVHDVANEVMCGFGKASLTYDPARGVRFTTYSYRAGWQAAKLFLRRELHDGFKAPADMERGMVPKVGPIIGDNFIRSTDAPPLEEHSLLWNQATADLCPRDAAIITWRFRDGLTLRVIANRLEITPQRAQQLMAAVIRKIRNNPDVMSKLAEHMAA